MSFQRQQGQSDSAKLMGDLKTKHVQLENLENAHQSVLKELAETRKDLEVMKADRATFRDKYNATNRLLEEKARHAKCLHQELDKQENIRTRAMDQLKTVEAEKEKLSRDVERLQADHLAAQSDMQASRSLVTQLRTSARVAEAALLQERHKLKEFEQKNEYLRESLHQQKEWATLETKQCQQMGKEHQQLRSTVDDLRHELHQKEHEAAEIIARLQREVSEKALDIKALRTALSAEREGNKSVQEGNHEAVVVSAHKQEAAEKELEREKGKTSLLTMQLEQAKKENHDLDSSYLTQRDVNCKLQAEVIELKKKLQYTEQNHKTFQKEVQFAENGSLTTLELVQQEVDRLEMEKAQVTAQWQDAEVQCKKLANEQSQLQGLVHTLSEQLQTTDWASERKLCDQDITAQSRERELMDQVESHRLDYSKLLSESHRKEKYFEEKVLDLTNSLQQLSRDVGSRDLAISDLQKELGDTKVKMAQVEEKADHRDGDMSTKMLEAESRWKQINNELQATILKYQDDITTLQTQLTETGKKHLDQLTELQNEVRTTRREYNEVKQQNLEYTDKLSFLEHQLHNKDTNVHTYKSALEDLESRLEQERTKLQHQLQMEKDSINKELDKCQKEKTVLQCDLDSAVKTNKQHEKALALANAQLDEMAELKKEYEACCGKLNKQSTEMRELQEDISLLEIQNKQLEEEVKQLDQSKLEAEERAGLLRQEMQTSVVQQQSNDRRSRSTMHDLEAEVSVLSDNMVHLESQIEIYKTALQAKEQKEHSLQEQVNNLSMLVQQKAASESHRKSTDTVLALKQKIAELEREHSETQQTVLEIQSDLIIERANHKTLEIKLKETTAMHTRTEKSLREAISIKEKGLLASELELLAVKNQLKAELERKTTYGYAGMSLEDELNTQYQKMSQLEQELSEIKMQKSDLDSKLKQQLSAIQTLKAELDQERAEKLQAVTEKAQKTQEAALLTETKKALQTLLSEREEKLHQLEAHSNTLLGTVKPDVSKYIQELQQQMAATRQAHQGTCSSLDRTRLELQHEIYNTKWMREVISNVLFIVRRTQAARSEDDEEPNINEECGRRLTADVQQLADECIKFKTLYQQADTDQKSMYQEFFQKQKDKLAEEKASLLQYLQSQAETPQLEFHTDEPQQGGGMEETRSSSTQSVLSLDIRNSDTNTTCRTSSTCDTDHRWTGIQHHTKVRTVQQHQSAPLTATTSTTVTTQQEETTRITTPTNPIILPEPICGITTVWDPHVGVRSISVQPDERNERDQGEQQYNRSSDSSSVVMTAEERKSSEVVHSIPTSITDEPLAERTITTTTITKSIQLQVLPSTPQHQTAGRRRECIRSYDQLQFDQQAEDDVNNDHDNDDDNIPTKKQKRTRRELLVSRPLGELTNTQLDNMPSPAGHNSGVCEGGKKKRNSGNRRKRKNKAKRVQQQPEDDCVPLSDVLFQIHSPHKANLLKKAKRSHSQLT